MQSAVLCPPGCNAPLIIVVASTYARVRELALARGAIALTRCASTSEAPLTKPAGAYSKLELQTTHISESSCQTTAQNAHWWPGQICNWRYCKIINGARCGMCKWSGCRGVRVGLGSARTRARTQMRLVLSCRDERLVRLLFCIWVASPTRITKMTSTGKPRQGAANL